MMKLMSWPRGRQRDGGVDRVPTLEGCGGLFLCSKHVIGPDPDAARLRIAPGAMVVCLNEARDLERYPEYQAWLNLTPEAIWFPIPDFDAPPAEVVRPLVRDIASMLEAGGDVIMHCSAGLGRTGTIAILVLVELGIPVDLAVKQVAMARPGAGPQAGAQSDLVVEYVSRPSS